MGCCRWRLGKCQIHNDYRKHMIVRLYVCWKVTHSNRMLNHCECVSQNLTFATIHLSFLPSRLHCEVCIANFTKLNPKSSSNIFGIPFQFWMQSMRNYLTNANSPIFYGCWSDFLVKFHVFWDNIQKTVMLSVKCKSVCCWLICDWKKIHLNFMFALQI